jgi:hypothetical protein
MVMEARLPFHLWTVISATGRCETYACIPTNQAALSEFKSSDRQTTGLIENIEVPDSSVMFGGVHLDWGTVGNVDSNDVPGTRTRFDASLAYTRHPNNIRIRNIKIGVMSRPFTTPGTGSDGIRFSGVHNITVENVFVESVTETGFFHTAGDLGYEFADNSVKPFCTQGHPRQ